MEGPPNGAMPRTPKTQDPITAHYLRHTTRNFNFYSLKCLFDYNSNLEDLPEGSVAQFSNYLPDILRVFVPADVFVLLLLLFGSQFEDFSEIEKRHGDVTWVIRSESSGKKSSGSTVSSSQTRFSWDRSARGVPSSAWPPTLQRTSKPALDHHRTESRTLKTR